MKKSQEDFTLYMVELLLRYGWTVFFILVALIFYFHKGPIAIPDNSDYDYPYDSQLEEQFR